MLEAIKEELHWLHLELPKQNLVTWTSGNISARDSHSGLVVIKPSGVRYEELRPEQMVVVDLEGDIVEGVLKPSSDTASHLYIYGLCRQRTVDSGLSHGAGGRIWGANPVWWFCPDRRGGDRPCGCRVDRLFACGAAQKPWCLHSREERACCAQSCCHGRRCGGDGLAGTAAGPA